MLNSHPSECLIAGQDILAVVRDNICKPCVSQGLNMIDVDFENPLECQCRCEKVQELLNTAKGFLDLAEN